MIKSFRGMQPQIDPSAFVAETAVIIGDVVIGEQSSIWYNCVVRGDLNYIRIGDRSNIQDLSVLHVSKPHGFDPGAPLIVGNDVSVGHSATLHGCTLHDGCVIGMHAMIMDKAVIGEGALIGARALVTEGTHVPPHTLWIGAPARYKRDLTPYEIDMQKQSPKDYVKYAQAFIIDQVFSDSLDYNEQP